MNSFSGVERALEAEFARQVAIVEGGGTIEQQTLLWDADRGTVRPARAKEGSHDYRYFPDPDLPPLRLTNEWIARARDRLPELPDAKRRRFAEEYTLSVYDIDVLTANLRLSEYFEAVAHELGDPKTAANWVMGEVLASLKNSGQTLERFPVRPADLATLLGMVRAGTVSNSAAKRIFTLMVQTGDRPEQIAEREGLVQVGDESQLASWVDEVLAAQPAEWQRYLGGEKKLLGVFVGAVMKKSGGRADPRKVNQLLATRANG
jgi:aspartyl-tRNA(Asn)/glutamyl-tRNA(Gln) amidotransferase subunit B